MSASEIFFFMKVWHKKLLISLSLDLNTYYSDICWFGQYVWFILPKIKGRLFQRLKLTNSSTEFIVGLVLFFVLAQARNLPMFFLHQILIENMSCQKKIENIMDENIYHLIILCFINRLSLFLIY